MHGGNNPPWCTEGITHHGAQRDSPSGLNLGGIPISGLNLEEYPPEDINGRYPPEDINGRYPPERLTQGGYTHLRGYPREEYPP